MELLPLKSHESVNKLIPFQYREPILKALSFYPELQSVGIAFKLRKKHPVPYGTTPTLASLFKPASKRTYIITLLEEAKGPERSVLFKNLSVEIQVAVIAHELFHVLQFHSCDIPNLLKTVFSYPFPSFKKKMEREADVGAITHGQGLGLYKLAVYLRKVPGYLNQRPAIDKYYLKPHEIKEYLNQL